MGLYNDVFLPRAIEKVCSAGTIMKMRSRVVPLARGQVLEIGMGSGLNLSLYDPSRVDKLYGLDPVDAMRLASKERREQAPFEVEWLDASAEEIPLPADSIDSVVLTYTLCTIPNPERALAEIRRVLRPGGELLFCEHGLAPDTITRGVQKTIDPVWHRFAGGCHLNRKMSELLESAGFELENLQEEYARKVVRFLGFTSTGRARVSRP